MRKIFFIAMLVGFVVYAGFNLIESVTPYVTIAQARATSKNVQVKGLLDKNFAPEQIGDEFTFRLQDEDTSKILRVIFDGAKSDQFDEAYHIVAIGKYTATNDTFYAKKLLIKCPSKYEGQQPR